MTATQSNLAGLSRFIFRAPNWYVSLGFAVVLAAMAGIAAFDSGAATGTWRGLFFLGKDAWEGIFFIGVPTIVAAFGTSGVDRFVGGKLTPNRASLLALVCEIMMVTIVTAAAIVTVLTPLEQQFVYDALVVALASIFAFRLLVIMAVSRSSILVAAVPASLQSAAAAVLLFIYSGTIRFLSVGGPLLEAYLMPYLARADRAPAALSVIGFNHFVLLGVTCVVYALGVYVFIVTVDRPWRRSLGVSVLDFIRGFIGHIAEGTRELEEFFEQLGEEAIVPVTVLTFRRPSGEEKARFVLPMIHPGPMAEIGGGNLPKRIAEHTEGLAFPPHATAGHDFNLVTRREVDTVVDAMQRAHERTVYDSTATKSVRTESGEAKLLGQAFGDDALVVNTFSPGFADDVEYAVGFSAMSEARVAGIDDVLLVDAHNCNGGLDGGPIPHVTPGSQRSFDLIEGAGRTGRRLGSLPQSQVHLGVAWDETPWDPEDGIGPLGVRVAVTRVDDQETAYVLVDGNNMEPGLRDRMVEALSSAVDEVEVMTTDTHIVNTVEAENQVGAHLDESELLALAEDLIERARADVEPVEAGMAREDVTVTVFGNDRTEMLASHANAVVSMGGVFAGAIIAASMAVSLLIFLLT
jgi:putative membrane protein